MPALYDPKGIYSYWYGLNWRALVTMILVVGPLIPGMANKISSSVNIGIGLERLFSFNWLYGFVLSIVLYVSLHLVFPDSATTIPTVVHGLPLDTDSEKQSVREDAKMVAESSKVREIYVSN